MNAEALLERFRALALEAIPLPAHGQTALRHRRLMQAGREDLSLARLIEAHWDAVAILAEAGRRPEPGALYGVWASEIPGQALIVTGSAVNHPAVNHPAVNHPDANHTNGGRCTLTGAKMFCSGAGLIDRALVTAGPSLIDLDLRRAGATLAFDESVWKTDAFADTRTAKATFADTPFAEQDLVGPPNWYLDRPGFWHGACGPAACWAGGAEGLLDYAMHQSRADHHTLAHLGAIAASIWANKAYLEQAGHEIDAAPNDIPKARIRARTVRHLIEQQSSDVLRRLSRAYGPHPQAMNEAVSRRYRELDLYLRQCHAERDLEALGTDLQASRVIS